MNITGLVFFIAAASFVLIQAILVWIYVRYLNRKNEGVESFEPELAIVLCVRGEDPSLKDCIEAIASQDYANKKLFIVGDNEQDPGIQFCRQYEQTWSDWVSIHINSEILNTCSVKCSNLISTVRQIESQFDFIVLVDADTVPGPGWLNNMIRPFQDEAVQVASGIRWFDVTGKKLGTWVRYIWNTAAIVQMVCYKIPWGGSLALRTSFLRNSDVLDGWSRGFCEDTMLQKLATRAKGKVEVVREAIIPSEEETSIGNCIPWISRQLLTARLHHPRWPLVLAHGLNTAVLTFGTLVLCVVSLSMAYWTAAIWFGAGHLVVQLGNLWLLNWIESPVRNLRKTSSTFWKNPVLFLASIGLTQFCYVIAMLRTVFARHVLWRQVTYRLRGKKVELLEFKPFEVPAGDHESL